MDSMTEKKCSSCGEIKLLSEFYKNKNTSTGKQPNCKDCHKQSCNTWNNKHIKQVTETKRRWRKRNQMRIKSRPSYCRWRKKYPEKMREINRKSNKKTRNTTKGRLTNNISSRISHILSGEKAGRHWEGLVGYTVDQLKAHLEKRFKKGMTWENYGTIWHIDHKNPVSAFNYEKPEDIDFKKCWELKNLQPLWVKDNLIKNAKIDKPFQPSLPISI